MESDQQCTISSGHVEVKHQVFTNFYHCANALLILLPPFNIPPQEYRVSLYFHSHHKHIQFTSFSMSPFSLFIELITES